MMALALTACASKPPPPDWQANAKAATERAAAAYLNGNARVEAAELARARAEVARTGRADLLARVELVHCAAQVASLVFGPCAGFEAVRADAAAPERAYADYLLAKIAPADIALLPEPHRAVAAGGPNTAGGPNVAANGAGGRNDAATAAGDPNDAATAATLAAIAEPLSRLVAAGVLLEAGRASPGVMATAIDTASAQGWRRPLLAWLGVQLKRAEAAGAGDAAERLRRRIELVGRSPGG